MPICEAQRPEVLETKPDEALYRELIKAKDVRGLRRYFPQYFTGRPEAGEAFALEHVTRGDLANMMRGLYFKQGSNFEHL